MQIFPNLDHLCSYLCSSLVFFTFTCNSKPKVGNFLSFQGNLPDISCNQSCLPLILLKLSFCSYNEDKNSQEAMNKSTAASVDLHKRLEFARCLSSCFGLGFGFGCRLVSGCNCSLSSGRVCGVGLFRAGTKRGLLVPSGSALTVEI